MELEIYELYRDDSDKYHQNYDTFGYYTNKEVARRDMLKLVKDEFNLKEDELGYIKYEYSCYGIKQIKVNTEQA
jgi:hypothetical protein